MRRLLISTIVLFSFLVLSVSCEGNKHDDNSVKRIAGNKISKNIDQENEDLQLFKQTCYVCHSVTSHSHDELIAPPMIAVKRRYLRSFPDREDFIYAVVGYASDPKEERALMMGAIQQFNVMPKQNFNEEDLKRIAAYIYDHEIEKPAWFESHFQEEHTNGMGRGNGRGRRGMND